MIKFIEKHDNVFSLILIILSIYGVTIDVILENADELWNFQNVYKMYNGFQIYNDINVIVTPLFFWIGKLLLTILGANLLTFRIYNIIIMAIIYFLTYLLLKKLKINKKVVMIIVLLLILLKGYCLVLSQANYNSMALMLCILGVLFYLNQYKHHSIIQGVLLFLIFITKQNIGVFYAIGLFFSEIITITNRKEKIKNIIIESSVFLTFLILMLTYFYHTKTLYNFVNYTVLGIQEFANENMFINISNLILSVFFVIINLVLTKIFIKNNKVNLEQKKQLVVLNCFSIPLILIMIPIFNDSHFLLGIYLSLLLFSFLMYLLVTEIKIKIKNTITCSVLMVLSFLTCFISTMYFVNWSEMVFAKDYRFDRQEPFYGGIYDEELIENMEHVIAYIENHPKRVIVLSSKASIYMIPTKRNNGKMDLPLKGNLGKDGEKGLIEEIKKLNNIEILIEKDENKIHYQESKKVREYMIKNMDKKGEIEEFEIYQQK